MNKKAIQVSSDEKTELHPRNKHRFRYNFNILIKACPELKAFVKINEYEIESINFFNPNAVKVLNKALLKVDYKIDYWEIPANYLCPPIPGRADYVHYMADLLSSSNNGVIPTGKNIKCLDIGVGANCVYPAIANSEYDWSFVGSDIDPIAVAAATKIVEMNPSLNGNIEIRLQKNKKDIFNGIIQKGERFSISICNPPFHNSLVEAQAATIKKLSSLTNKKVSKPTLNFGGSGNELWYHGGEQNFIRIMITQSIKFKNSCLWFSSLISKQSNLEDIYTQLNKAGAIDIKTIPMGQGNKISRIVAWTFHTHEKQISWLQKTT